MNYTKRHFGAPELWHPRDEVLLARQSELLERELLELERLYEDVGPEGPEVSQAERQPQAEHQPRKSGRQRTRKRHFDEIE